MFIHILLKCRNVRNIIELVVTFKIPKSQKKRNRKYKEELPIKSLEQNLVQENFSRFRSALHFSIKYKLNIFEENICQRNTQTSYLNRKKNYILS